MCPARRRDWRTGLPVGAWHRLQAAAGRALDAGVSCAHHFVPCAHIPFQVMRGAAWASEYCRCGEAQYHLINPNSNQPITEDQSDLDIGVREAMMQWLRERVAPKQR